MLINSAFGRTFLFLSKLAWRNRVALPALIMVGCMVLNYRGEIEINIHTERIALHDLPNHRHQQHHQQGGGGAFAGIAIDHLEDYSDEDEEEDDDDEDYYESDDDEDDEFFSYDEDDVDDETYDDGDDDEDDADGPLGDRMLNGTIRLNWYTTLNIHNARR
uniref:Uncharacterized protein n=1 Tax=Anopheles stephensi TaxID=30069 RepID=A0A182XZX9_ANOST